MKWWALEHDRLVADVQAATDPKGSLGNAAADAQLAALLPSALLMSGARA